MAINGELMEASGSSAGALISAEVDVQITTAHRYPRDLARVLAKAELAACSTQEVAESCRYARDVGGGKTATGPSIRLAEIVAACYGNLRVQGLHIATDSQTVTVRGMAWDLESNYAVSSDVTRSIMTSAKRGVSSRYSDTQIAVTIQAALAIAKRNAIVDCIGRAHFIALLRKTDAVAAGSKSSQKSRARQVVERIQKAYGLSTERILEAVGLFEVDDLEADQINDLLARGTAIHDGDSTIDDVFPPLPVGNGVVAPESAKATETSETGEIDLDALTGSDR